jgi:hypothetical protein
MGNLIIIYGFIGLFVWLFLESITLRIINRKMERVRVEKDRSDDNPRV